MLFCYVQSPAKHALSVISKDTLPKDTIVIQDSNFEIIMKWTNKGKISTGEGDVPNNELWIKYKSGKEELMVACRNANNPDSIIGDIYAPQLSNDKAEVYFLSAAYATSDELHGVNLKTKQERAVCAANFFEIIRSGKYKNDIIVNQHRYRFKKPIGSYNWFYIVDEQGKVLKTLGESSKKFGLSAGYN